MELYDPKIRNGLLSSGTSLLIHLFNNSKSLTDYLSEVVFYHLQGNVLDIIANNSDEFIDPIINNFVPIDMLQTCQNKKAYIKGDSTSIQSLIQNQVANDKVKIIETFLLLLNASGTFFSSKNLYKKHVVTFFEFTFEKLFTLIRNQPKMTIQSLEGIVFQQ